MRTITSLGSFAVKNDGSEDFKTYVLEPLNEIIREMGLLTYDGRPDKYYGIREHLKCPVYFETPDQFERILTVSQVKEYLSGRGKGFGCNADDLRKAIDDIKKFQATHIKWAEYFEANPEKEKEYLATGNWDCAHEHRRIVDCYDNVLNFLIKTEG